MKHEKTIAIVFNVWEVWVYLLWDTYACVVLLKLGFRLQESSIDPCLRMCDRLSLDTVYKE